MVLRFLSATFIEQGAGTAGLGNGPLFLWISLGVGVLGLIFALIMARSVLASDTGTPEMQLISNAIREGAEAFMTRQYTTIALLAVALAVALYLGYKTSAFTAPMAN